MSNERKADPCSAQGAPRLGLRCVRKKSLEIVQAPVARVSPDPACSGRILKNLPAETGAHVFAEFGLCPQETRRHGCGRLGEFRQKEHNVMQRNNIVVLGAGSIGAFVGGSLIAALADVSLIGRATMRGRIECHGLLMSGARGWEARVPSSMVRFSETSDALCAADLVIVA